jgi:hypothetical protein
MRRQRLVEPVDQLVMKAVTDGEAAGQGDEDDDEPRAELAEMIDKLRGVIVAPGVEADALLRGLLVLALEARERPLGRNLVALGGNCKAVVLDRLVAGDRVLELAETATHRASHLREALRAEHEQDDETEQEDLWHSDEAGHLIPSVMSEMGRPGFRRPEDRAVLADDEPGGLDCRQDLLLGGVWPCSVCRSSSPAAPVWFIRRLREPDVRRPLAIS